MRIDNWGMGAKMMLPDELFGRRFLVSCTVEGGSEAAAWDMSEIAFPEHAVIWEFRVFSELTAADLISVRVALGDQLPTSQAMMTALEPLVAGLGAQGPDPRIMGLSLDGRLEFTQLRFGMASAGRKLVLEVMGAQGKTPRVTVGVVVSSVPREVPEWLYSEKDREHL